MKADVTDNALIVGLDFMVITPCRCGCSKVRVTYHSKKSKGLILRCPWCRSRRSLPREDEIRRLREFAGKYGFSVQPLILHENGEKTYVLR